MYLQRLNTPRMVGILCALAFVGLISLLFQPSIEALLQSLSLQQRATTPLQNGQPSPPGKPIVIVTAPATATRPPARGTVITPPAPGTIVAQDTFQRIDQIFWGTASDGQKWAGDANASTAFAVTDHSGHILFSQSIYDALLGPREVNSEVLFSGMVNNFQNANLGAILRWQDKNNWYKAYLDGTELILLKDVAGVMTRLSSVPFPASANRSYILRFHTIGSQLQVKAWAAGDAEPTTWLIQRNDQGLTTAGYGGLRIILGAGDEATITSFTELAFPA